MRSAYCYGWKVKDWLFNLFHSSRTFVLVGSLIPTIAYDPSDGATYLTLVNKDPISDEMVDKTHADNMKYIFLLNIFLLVFIQIRIEFYKRKVKIQVVPDHNIEETECIVECENENKNFQYERSTTRIIFVCAMTPLLLLLAYNIGGKLTSDDIVLERLRRRILLMFMLANGFHTVPFGCEKSQLGHILCSILYIKDSPQKSTNQIQWQIY